MGNYTHIKITSKGHKDLKFLADRHQQTQIAYASRAFVYLKKTGLNIFDDDVVDIPGLLNKMDARLIGFLKTREKDFFIPMNEALHEQIRVLKQVLFGLETFDIVSFTQQKNEENNSKKTLLRAPKNSPQNEMKTAVRDDEKNNEIKSEKTEEKLSENPSDKEQLHRENELLKMKLESLTLKSDAYAKELNFFLSNIVPGSALSSSKYVFKGNQNDLKRVKSLIQ